MKDECTLAGQYKNTEKAQKRKVALFSIRGSYLRDGSNCT